MKCLIVGYGKMGKSIAQQLTQRGHEIIAIIDQETDKQNLQFSDTIDTAFEFSQPEAAVCNYKWLMDRHIPIVSGTTGWYEHMHEVHQYCKDKNGTFFHSSNFSLGMNIFFKLNQWLARTMKEFPQYTLQLEEVHHIHKKDKPSGTAITLAQDILRMQGKNVDATTRNFDFPIQSIREGEHAGMHIVKYHSSGDEIMLKHNAIHRDEFAIGAVLAAEWVNGKKGIFTMDDFLQIAQ